MKVYITFEKDGYGGDRVEKVFKSKHKAQYWVIDSCLRDSLPSVKDEGELLKRSLQYIEVYEVVD